MGDFSVVSAISDSMTAVSGDMLDTLSAILPIALGVIGASVAVTFGIKLFKRLTGRA